MSSEKNTLNRQLRLIGAPDELQFRAIGMSFDGVWRQASAEEKEWLLRATGRWTSNESPADPDEVYRPAPLKQSQPLPDAGTRTSYRRPTFDMTPVPATMGTTDDEFLALQSKTPPSTGTRWMDGLEAYEKGTMQWIPPHLRQGKKHPGC